MKHKTPKKTAPKKIKSQKKEYNSFDEFLQAAFPADLKNHMAAKTADPYEFGAEMAKGSSAKLEKLLSTRII